MTLADGSSIPWRHPVIARSTFLPHAVALLAGSVSRTWLGHCLRIRFVFEAATAAPPPIDKEGQSLNGLGLGFEQSKGLLPIMHLESRDVRPHRALAPAYEDERGNRDWAIATIGGGTLSPAVRARPILAS